MARREQALHLRYCEDFREFTEKVLRSHITSSYDTKIQNVYKEVYDSTIISSFDSVNTATINAFDKTWIRLENSNGEFRWKKE